MNFVEGSLWACAVVSALLGIFVGERPWIAFWFAACAAAMACYWARRGHRER